MPFDINGGRYWDRTSDPYDVNAGENEEKQEHRLADVSRAVHVSSRAWLPLRVSCVLPRFCSVGYCSRNPQQIPISSQ